MFLQYLATGIYPSLVALELIALALMHRDCSVSKPLTVDESRYRPAAVEAAAQEAMMVGVLISFLESPWSGVSKEVVFRSTLREIHLRNPILPHMLLDTLRGLFDDPEINEDCRAAFGFTAMEALEVMETVQALHLTGVGHHVIHALRQRATRGIGDEPQARPPDSATSDGSPPTVDGRTAVHHTAEALRAPATPPQPITIDVAAVAQRTGYPPSTVEAVLDAFTLPAVTNLDEALDRFFRGDNPLRTAPIVSDRQGRRMLVHDGLALAAVREVIETGLKNAQRTLAYERHRGKLVEHRAVDLLAEAFPHAKVFRGFTYLVPDPQATCPQTSPDQFTKQVEGDGLLLVDDVAIIVEVKSVALTAGARGGTARRLRDKLRRIITAAADQADRLRSRILTDKQIRLGDGGCIDLSNIREVHSIAVGLEDLSGVTTATATLVEAGLLRPDHIPWTVSLHDLWVVCEVLDRPSELLLYLRRRTHPQVTRKYWAVTETELLCHFLAQGLYVPPDPRQLAERFPWLEPPSEAEIRRFEDAQRPIFVPEVSASLHAWYRSQGEPEVPGVVKPRFNANAKLLELVDQISATAAPGWLSTTTSLLEAEQKLQKTFGRIPAKLAGRVRHDRQNHYITQVILDTLGKPVVLVWACHGPTEDVDAVASTLSHYLHVAKQQTGARRASCMIFDPAGERLVRLLYDNRPPGAGPAPPETVTSPSTHVTWPPTHLGHSRAHPTGSRRRRRGQDQKR